MSVNTTASESKSARPKTGIWILLALAAIGALLGFTWFKLHSAPVMQKRTRFLMDTPCSIQIPGGLEVLPVIDRALDRAEAIDKKFNCLNPASPIYAFNNQNEPIADPELVGVIKTALQVSRQSDGAFDITVYPLVRLWGFFTPSPRLPSDAEIKAALKNVGYQHVYIKEEKVYKDRQEIGVDLGAIAKGYAVGEAVKIIKQAGIASALIDFGGDIYALGTIQKRPWKVGIRDPRGDGVIGAFDISDLSTATSGDYERFFEKDGVRYNHILDPKTGYSARQLISITVITPDATLADAWSTALFVLGKEKALALEAKIPLAGVVLMTPDRKIVYSPELAKGMEIIKRKGK